MLGVCLAYVHVPVHVSPMCALAAFIGSRQAGVLAHVFLQYIWWTSAWSYLVGMVVVQVVWDMLCG